MDVPVTLGDRIYRKKKDIAHQARTILAGYKGSGVQRLSPKDHDFALDLLFFHPRVGSKLAGGVEAIVVALAKHRTYTRTYACFHVLTASGELVDFSWSKCVSPPSRQTQAKRALRLAVQSQILGFKARNQAPICAISGERLRRGRTHIDHVQRFECLVQDWCKVEGVTLEDVETVEADVGRVLKSERLKQSFRDYHAQHAQLRATTAQANLRRARSWGKLLET